MPVGWCPADNKTKLCKASLEFLASVVRIGSKTDDSLRSPSSGPLRPDFAPQCAHVDPANVAPASLQGSEDVGRVERPALTLSEERYAITSVHDRQFVRRSL